MTDLYVQFPFSFSELLEFNLLCVVSAVVDSSQIFLDSETEKCRQEITYHKCNEELVNVMSLFYSPLFGRHALREVLTHQVAATNRKKSRTYLTTEAKDPIDKRCVDRVSHLD